MITLQLADVVFQGFEAPEQIAFGGEQALLVHKLPGGDRVVDAMGPDDRDLSWSGRFRGGAAESRARRLDELRRQGLPLTLTWGTFRYRVLVRSFEAQYQQFEIPYSISCTVLDSGQGGIAGLLATIDEALGTDLSGALSLGGTLNLTNVTTALGQVQTAMGAVQSVKNASPESLASITYAVGAAQTAVTSAFSAADTALNTSAPSGSPAAMASSLSAQASAMGQLSQLYQLSGTVGRMAKNVANVGT